jgi:hypothetical protein
MVAVEVVQPDTPHLEMVVVVVGVEQHLNICRR